MTVPLDWMLPAALLVGVPALGVGLLIAWVLRRVARANSGPGRRAFREEALVALGAERATLAPLASPEALTGRGRVRFTEAGYVSASGDLQDVQGQIVAHYRLRWGAGPMDAVVTTREHTWTFAQDAGGATQILLDEQEFGWVQGARLLNAHGAEVGALGPARGGWRGVHVRGHAVAVLGAATSGALVRGVPTTLEAEARLWITALALRVGVEAARNATGTTAAL
ncbi:hypothetical protein [Deinococcus maricopensis]|uniref:Uncharacterized protein n=1 Tax=Deinococcus maricopensis (strain DSM 21211 / LMG 22137 / NRRL B-23946 / LB-34) TaxID=709986 RepID=E8UC36_DEIML|nr:hypothetical protein [Deinococcus maricopensis]ADV68697.1 hypothetical protein Deima_3068 [Deinococcus maricopensis DSM 21211]